MGLATWIRRELIGGVLSAPILSRPGEIISTPRLKTGADASDNQQCLNRAEFFALPFTFHIPLPSGAEIEHLDEGRECHGEIDISFIDMLAESLSD